MSIKVFGEFLKFGTSNASWGWRIGLLIDAAAGGLLGGALAGNLKGVLASLPCCTCVLIGVVVGAFFGMIVGSLFGEDRGRQNEELVVEGMPQDSFIAVLSKLNSEARFPQDSTAILYIIDN